MRKGKLIVLEGGDGSGKRTQAALLARRLRRAGYKIATLQFPQYGKKSAGLVEEYLNGKYGKRPEEVGPYAASLFYALDRFDAAFKIRAWLGEGRMVVLDRYVDSNAGHQGAKIFRAREYGKFLRWLYDMEYRILGAPKPDMVFILHVPSAIGQELVGRKAKRAYLKRGKRDIHEEDLSHLRRTEAAYLALARAYPKNHIVISCMEGGSLLSPKKINTMLWKVLEKRVLEKHS